MFGTVSTAYHAALSRLNTYNTSAPAAGSFAAGRTENAALPVQPVPAAREVVSNESKFSIESMLDRHASDPVAMAARMRIQQPGQQAAQPLELEEAKSAQEVFEESECQTCAGRKYKDGSADPGVSFKAATHLSPEQAATAVRSHEMEHVTRNQAKAQREDRKIVSQSVTIHTDICPECGRVYTSGGTTRTVTSGKDSSAAQQNPTASAFSVLA